MVRTSDEFTVKTTDVPSGWFFMTMTFDLTSLSVYHDAEIISSVRGTASTIRKPGNRRLQYAGSTHPIRDKAAPVSLVLDEMTFWDRPLSIAEVKALYDSYPEEQGKHNYVSV